MNFSIKLFAVFAICVLCSSAQGQFTNPINPVKKERWERNQLLSGIPEKEFKRIRELRQEILKNGCNSNICFVLDGSSSVTGKEFMDQKNFVDLIIAITGTDEPGNYCAAVYDNFFDPVSQLTKLKLNFLSDIRKLKKSHYSGRPRLMPALGYAFKQLRPQKGDANNVIFFSKEKPLYYPKQFPYWIRQLMRQGYASSAVTFKTDNAPYLAKITGDINRVNPIDGFFNLSETIVAVVADACSTRCSTIPERKNKAKRRRHFGPQVHCPKRLGGTRRFRKFKNTSGDSKPSPLPKKQ